jgi:hypothetical protein
MKKVVETDILEKYDYFPVLGDPKNGFYPVQKGKGTHYWNGKRIVPKEEGTTGREEGTAIQNL